MAFYKYGDSATVFQDSDTNAFSSADQAFKAGVKKDWSNVETRQRTPAPAPVSTPTFSFMDKSIYDVNQNPLQVSNSSTPVDNAVSTLGNNINKASVQTSDPNGLLATLQANQLKQNEDFAKYDAEQKKYNDSLQTQREALAKRKEDALKQLDAEYNTEKATKEANYKTSIEPYNRRLQLLKDTPYGANATIEEDLKLKMAGIEQSHKLEMDTLFNHRQSSIATALSAYEDKDFALAESMMKNAKESEKLIYDRNQDFLSMSLQMQQEQRAQQIADYNKLKEEKANQQEAQKFAIENGISAPFYSIGKTVYRTGDNKAYSSPEEAQADGVDISSWKNVQQIATGSKAEADYVKNLANQYGDTVFPTMTAEQAQKAMQYSRIYQDKVRPPNNSLTDKNTFKFDSSARGQLLSKNFTNDEITQIESDLQKYSVEQVTNGMTAEQKKAIKFVLDNASYSQQQKDTESKLTRQNLSNLFGIPDNNEKGSIFGFDHGKTNAEKLSELENTVKKYKDVGYTDAEILKLMQ